MRRYLHRSNRNQYARRLPPIWWIKRGIKVKGTFTFMFEAVYVHGRDTWSVTSNTREDAVEGLIDWLRGVKDGSVLKEFYEGRENATDIA